MNNTETQEKTTRLLIAGIIITVIISTLTFMIGRYTSTIQTISQKQDIPINVSDDTKPSAEGSKRTAEEINMIKKLTEKAMAAEPITKEYIKSKAAEIKAKKEMALSKEQLERLKRTEEEISRKRQNVANAFGVSIDTINEGVEKAKQSLPTKKATTTSKKQLERLKRIDETMAVEINMSNEEKGQQIKRQAAEIKAKKAQEQADAQKNNIWYQIINFFKSLK